MVAMKQAVEENFSFKIFSSFAFGGKTSETVVSDSSGMVFYVLNMQSSLLLYLAIVDPQGLERESSQTEFGNLILP